MDNKTTTINLIPFEIGKIYFSFSDKNDIIVVTKRQRQEIFFQTVMPGGKTIPIEEHSKAIVVRNEDGILVEKLGGTQNFECVFYADCGMAYEEFMKDCDEERKSSMKKLSPYKNKKAAEFQDWLNEKGIGLEEVVRVIKELNKYNFDVVSYISKNKFSVDKTLIRQR